MSQYNVTSFIANVPNRRIIELSDTEALTRLFNSVWDLANYVNVGDMLGNARVEVLKNTVTVGTRRAINLIEGTNVTLTIIDDSVNERVDVTIASTGGGGGGAPTNATYVVITSDPTLSNEVLYSSLAPNAHASSHAAAGSDPVTISGSQLVASDVTFAKLQNIGTDRLVGRDTAGSGSMEELTVGGGVEFTGAGGIQRSALTGDVTASAGSNFLTIPNDTVTYAKIQNVSATDRLLGRDTAGVGDIEELTVGGGVEFTGAGGIRRSALTGDVTATAGSNNTTIANNAVTTVKISDDQVTFAKMQNIATDRLLGRDTVASGDPEELTVGGGIEFTGTGGIQRSALSGDVTATAGSNSTTIANNAVTDVKLRDSAALSVIGRASNTTGDPADIVSATPGEVLQRTVSNTLVFDVIYTDSLRDGAVTLSKMGDIATDRIIGRDTAGTGVPESLTVGGGVEFTGAGGIQRSALTGDVTSSAGSNTTTIPNDTVTYAKIQNVTATDRLLGRDTAGVGDIEELTVGGGLEFTGTGGIQRSALSGDVVAAAGSNSTTIANNAVTDAKLRDSAALSVIGRGSNTTGDPADIVAANAGEVLQRSGTTLIFDFVNTVSIRDAAVTLAKMDNLATDRIIGRDTVGTGVPESLTVTGGLEFTGTGGIQRSALSGDVTATAGSNSTTIANNAVTTVKIADDQVTFAKMQNIATDRLLGRDTAASGDPEELTVGGGVEFTGTGGIQRSALTGDVTATAGSNSTTIANNAVTDAKIRDSAALSVIGRASNTTGDPADIVAANASEVLQRSVSNTLIFGPVDTGSLRDGSVTLDKMDSITTDSLLGRDTVGTGTPEVISVGGGIEFTGAGGIRRSALTGDVTATAGSNSTTIANNAVTYAKMQDVTAASRVLGKGTSGAGDPEELSLGSGLAMDTTTLDTLAMVISKHVISSNLTIPDGYSAVVSRYVEIAANITLTIGSDSDLEIL